MLPDRDEVAALLGQLDQAEGYLRASELESKRQALQTRILEPGFWDDQTVARGVTAELANINEDLTLLKGIRADLDDLEAFIDLSEDDPDPSLAEEGGKLRDSVSSRLRALELRSLFSGEFDEADAVCEVHSGAGGTDSQDWAEMLLRMYQRWAERRGFEVELDERSEGQEAGISSATFIVRGRYAFGMLAAERGVHRLVRISPFDSQARRHTSFASFTAVPFLEELSGEVEIEEKDLRIDTYRASGAGGQHINTTDSAVRITHLPTGVVVSCQNERSQHQNKARALQILAAKLADLARQERESQVAELGGEKRDVAWGSQIRSYVLHPYQLVKDLRTSEETGNVAAVLDGDLDRFIESFLQWRRSQDN